MSRFRLLLLAVGIVGVLLVAGCRKPVGFFQQQPTTPQQAPASPTSPAAPGAQDLGQEAIQTVTAYLQALEKLDYGSAYAQLSSASQSQYSAAEFTKVCKRYEVKGKQGMPQYDLSKPGTPVVKEDTAMVELHEQEDPATHAFHLVRENGRWHVVYRGGAPGQPSAE